jgi:hypothetical protein
MGGAREGRCIPFAAALALAAGLATPAAHAAPLVSQFRSESAFLIPGSDIMPAASASSTFRASFGPYADLEAADAEDGPASPALEAGSPGLALLGRLRLSAFLLFLFPQYTQAITPPPPAPPTLVETPTLPHTAVVLNSVHGPWTFPFVSVPTVHSPPPVSELPEPATLLSGTVGAGIAGAFACWRRRKNSPSRKRRRRR